MNHGQQIERGARESAKERGRERERARERERGRERKERERERVSGSVSGRGERESSAIMRPRLHSYTSMEHSIIIALIKSNNNH